MRLFDRRPAEERFWAWFQTNRDRVAQGPAAGIRVAFGLTRRLRAVHPGLIWESGDLPDGTHEFTIGAEGDHEVAPYVRRLVAAAPALPGWRIVAFRQRDDRADSIRVSGGGAFAERSHVLARLATPRRASYLSDADYRAG